MVYIDKKDGCSSFDPSMADLILDAKGLIPYRDIQLYRDRNGKFWIIDSFFCIAQMVRSTRALAKFFSTVLNTLDTHIYELEVLRGDDREEIEFFEKKCDLISELSKKILNQFIKN